MLRVIICCDVDHDILGYNIQATRFDLHKEKLGWRSIENISKIKEICNLVEDCESNNPKVTWFVRSDEQLRIIFDDYAYPVRNYLDVWKKLKHQRDEIGWHPHLWRWSEKNHCWYQEISDNEWISCCIEKGYKDFVKILKNVSSVRMGWGFHNNFTMKTMNDLGLTVDLSAAPGLEHEGSPDERGSHFLNHYDWSITPEKPYHPSQQDYRRPSKNNEKSLSILEIPVTTAPKKLSKILIGKTLKLTPINLRRRLLKGADIESKHTQNRYVANITDMGFQHIVKQKLKQVQQSRNTATNLVAIFHPIELFQPKKFHVLEKNLKTLTEISRKLKVRFRFLTATQMAKEIKTSC